MISPDCDFPADHVVSTMPESLRSLSQLGLISEPRKYTQGAEVTEFGVRYRTWCEHDKVELVILDDSDQIRRIVPLEPEENGYFSGYDAQGKPGDRYKY